MALKSATRLGIVSLGLVLAACGQDGRDKAEETSTAPAALGVAIGARTIPWGDATLGFQPAGTNSAALGVPAVAIGRGGLYLLDALHGRVVRVDGDKLTKIASVPVDSDDLAFGPDGAFAVKRSIKQEVLVFGPDGAPAGRVDTGALDAISTITLGRSRQVLAQNGFQETFSFGSPSVPQLPAQVLAAKREGSSFLSSGDGVVAIHTDAGELELRTVPAGGREAARRNAVPKTVSLGKGTAARVVGTSGSLACARVEHVTQEASGALVTAREAACVDMNDGRVVLRTALPAPGAYVPRRELVFANGMLAFARPTEAGLELQTWKIDGGAR